MCMTPLTFCRLKPGSNGVGYKVVRRVINNKTGKVRYKGFFTIFAIDTPALFDQKYYRTDTRKFYTTSKYQKRYYESDNKQNGFHIFTDYEGAVKFIDWVNQKVDSWFYTLDLVIVKVRYKELIAEGFYSSRYAGGANQSCITAKYMKIIKEVDYVKG